MRPVPVPVVSLLLCACASPKPTFSHKPVASDPVATAAPPTALVEPRAVGDGTLIAAPKSPDELVAVERQLQDADAEFFARQTASARAKFEEAWKQHHPNPLALVMVAHAAGALGDTAAQRAFLGRARDEARQTPSRSVPSSQPVEPWEKDDATRCGLVEVDEVRFDGLSSAWVSDGRTHLRVDLGQRRVLYGFCGVATRDAAANRFAPVTWMPGRIEAHWQHPTQNGRGEGIDLFDFVYGTRLRTVPHAVEHIDYNEEYHGRIAFSADGSTMASAANAPDREVRVWRVSDGKQIRALQIDERAEALRLSDDGSLVAIGTCSKLVIKQVAGGGDVQVREKCLGCAYGSGIGYAVFDMAFSPDKSLLALGYIAVAAKPGVSCEKTAKGGGMWLAVHRTKDGGLVKRFEAGQRTIRFSPDGRLIGSTPSPFGNQAFLIDLKRSSVEVLESRPIRFSPDGKYLATSWGVLSVSESGKLENAISLDSVAQAALAESFEWIGPYWIPKGGP